MQGLINNFQFSRGWDGQSFPKLNVITTLPHRNVSGSSWCALPFASSDDTPADLVLGLLRSLIPVSVFYQVFGPFEVSKHPSLRTVWNPVRH